MYKVLYCTKNRTACQGFHDPKSNKFRLSHIATKRFEVNISMFHYRNDKISPTLHPCRGLRDHAKPKIITRCMLVEDYWIHSKIPYLRT